ncbi:MAG: nucleoside monophosphate kinase [Candidatus Micrarchaeota archaeon]
MNPDFFNGAQVFVLLGRTGSGKTRAGMEVHRKIGLPFISIGKLARTEAAKNSKLGVFFQQVFAEKKQVPDELVIEMIEQALHSQPGKFKRGFVLDNFPSTMKQVDLLDGLIKKYGLELNTVFHMYVPASLSLKRRTVKKRGKWEDPLERERFFQGNIVEVLMHYKHKKLLKTLRGSDSIKKSAARVAQGYNWRIRTKRVQKLTRSGLR